MQSILSEVVYSYHIFYESLNFKYCKKVYKTGDV